MSDSRVPVLLLVVLVTLNALVFAVVNRDRIVPGTDSEQYDLMARQLNAARGLTLSAAPPFVPTQFREPGYPLLVAAIYRISETTVEPIVWLQSLLLGLAAGCTALIGIQLFGRLPGLIGGALFGLNTESAHYAHWLLTEVPFVFLLTAVLVLALRAQDGGRRADVLAFGVGLGLAILVRVIAAPLVVPIGISLAASCRGARQRLRTLALVLVGLLVVLAPWLARNAATFGTPSISGRFGVNLIRRAARAAEPPAAYPAWIVASLWMATNPLSQLVYPISRFQWGPEYEDNAIWDFHVNDMVRYNQRYEPVCQPQPDPDACYAQIGLDFVRNYPVGYVVQSVFALITLLFAPLPGPQALEHNALVWVGILTIVALALRQRLGPPHALLVGVLGIYIAASIVVDTQVRYLMPAMPILAVFAAVPLAALVRRALALPMRVPATS